MRDEKMTLLLKNTFAGISAMNHPSKSFALNTLNIKF